MTSFQERAAIYNAHREAAARDAAFHKGEAERLARDARCPDGIGGLPCPWCGARNNETWGVPSFGAGRRFGGFVMSCRSCTGRWVVPDDSLDSPRTLICHGGEIPQRREPTA